MPNFSKIPRKNITFGFFRILRFSGQLFRFFFSPLKYLVGTVYEHLKLEKKPSRSLVDIKYLLAFLCNRLSFFRITTEWPIDAIFRLEGEGAQSEHRKALTWARIVL